MPLVDLSAELGVEVWVKREDRSGPIYGGNKVRKLEFLLGAALDQGASGVFTVGTLGSHHVLATALYARQSGLRCDAVLYPQHMTPHARRTLAATTRSGARLTVAGSPLTALPMGIFALIRASLGWTPRLPYIIAPGGSSPIGILGDVSAAFELAGQVRDGILPEPSHLVVPLGSGGTSAGLAIGLTWAGLRTRILSVSAVHPLFANRRAVQRLVKKTLKLLSQKGSNPPNLKDIMAHLEVDPSFYAPGYARPSKAGQRAASRLKAELHLDPGYTAKAAAALLQRGPQLPGPVLFWNTVSSIDITALTTRPAPLSTLPPALKRHLPSTITDH